MEKGEPRDFYEQLIETHGPTAQGVGWADWEEQYERFKVAIEMWPEDLSAPQTILDVGCGYGAFIEYIEAWGNNQWRQAKYAGFDINPGALDLAHAKYGSPKRLFACADIRWPTARGPIWDLVLGSGVLSYYEMPDKLEILKAMWDYTKQAMIFNIKIKDAYIADLSLILASFRTQRWAVRHDYKLDEVTVMVRRDDE